MQIGNDLKFRQIQHKADDNEAFVVHFSHEEDKFAQVSYHEQRTMIDLYKIELDLSCRLLAEIDITEEGGYRPQEVKVAFDQTRPDVFAYSYWTDSGVNGTFLAVIDAEHGVVTSTNISSGKPSPFFVAPDEANTLDRLLRRHQLLAVRQVSV